MRTVVVLCAAALLLPAVACGQDRQAPASRVQQGDPCVVERISDGDTIRCRGGRRVRLLLIDSPERDQRPFGEESARQLARILPAGSRARLEYDVQRLDPHGRTLAYVFTERGQLVNEEMLRRGYAVVIVFPPNVRYVKRFRAAADEARRAARGLWASSGFECLPRDWRARRC